MTGRILDINLFGACTVTSSEPGRFVIAGAKHKALFALLATAPFGRRTRSFLQETLWGQSCYDTGRQSLRRALADIKAAMGDLYPQVLASSNSEVTLDLSRVRLLGGPASGVFLEGLDIREIGFQIWVNGLRGDPSQLAGIYAFDLGAEAPALPVIAVIPFRAVASGEDDAALGDWLAEEVCRSLSRSRLITVISHLSSRQLARSVVELTRVRDLLKADFCVWGSLRNLGGEIVVDADFIDVRSGRILWTRQFAGPLSGFLERSSEGVAGIVAAVGAALADEAVAHVRGRPLAEIDDHRLLMAGVALMHRSALKDFARAKELVREAARRAPDAPESHAWLAKWHVLSIINSWSDDARRDEALAADAVDRALDLGADNSFALTIAGFIQCNLRRRLDVAERRYDDALARNPNEALAWLLKSALHTFRFEGPQAMCAARAARARSPIDPFGYFYDSLIAGAYLATGDFEQAATLADRSLATNDRHLSTLRVKIVALAQLGRLAEAREAAAALLRRDPEFRVATYMNTHPCADFEMGRIVERSLRAAGVP